MDFKKLTGQAKALIDKRGGTDALKADAQQLADIAKGKGSVADKAKQAAAALKEPGTGKPAPDTGPTPDPGASAPVAPQPGGTPTPTPDPSAPSAPG